jgi:hypothetical protein
MAYSLLQALKHSTKGRKSESGRNRPSIDCEEEISPISPYLSKIGRKGGLKGGKARTEKLSSNKRRCFAQKAVKAHRAIKEKTSNNSC